MHMSFDAFVAHCIEVTGSGREITRYEVIDEYLKPVYVALPSYIVRELWALNFTIDFPRGCISLRDNQWDQFMSFIEGIRMGVDAVIEVNGRVDFEDNPGWIGLNEIVDALKRARK